MNELTDEENNHILTHQEAMLILYRRSYKRCEDNIECSSRELRAISDTIKLKESIIKKLKNKTKQVR